MKAYHYTSGQGLFGILNSQELRCTNLRFMNDPSEEFYFDQLMKQILEKKGDKFKSVHDVLFSESYRNAVLSPTERHVVSFSKNGDSLSMWNYYSKGNGYNLEIDLNKVIELNTTYDLYVVKVEINYDENQQIELLEKLISDFKEKSERFKEGKIRMKYAISENEYYEIMGEIDPIEMDYNERLEELKIAFKHPAYSREEEVRLIVSEVPGQNEGENVKFRISNTGIFVSYIPLSLGSCDSVSRITTHPLNGELHRVGIEEFLKSEHKLKHIEAISSKIPFREV
ncbi:MAG TPA: hypothetical protein DEQ87_13705 [Algoriphagus sp.]|nr:hypothetical protein [Algoriphagus sp.]HAD52322.1 hypothetical protein [Algoriphagus sp.]HAH36819.1 hypothetical protein [Algoriphagus sp.]HCB46601.1 hypothetical protein [Algoriphagus sp.]HCD88675.1 hypothetical protein [Algoriphagus sp.]